MEQVKVMEREISRVYRCAARDDSECHHKVSDDVSADAKVSRRLIHIDDLMETGSMEDSFLLTFVSCFFFFCKVTRTPRLRGRSTAFVMT
jgi:hypothetical protein